MKVLGVIILIILLLKLIGYITLIRNYKTAVELTLIADQLKNKNK